MGTSLTTKHRLIKADDNEPIDVEQLNDNWDSLDKLLPHIVVGNIPEGKTPLIYFGKHIFTTGAGGENRENAFATDPSGFGGVWLGYNGIPKFEGVSFASIADGGNMAREYSGTFGILDQNTTRIKYRGVRHEGGGAMNGFASINLNVMIVGW